jgi:hypothetical protein
MADPMAHHSLLAYQGNIAFVQIKIQTNRHMLAYGQIES